MCPPSPSEPPCRGQTHTLRAGGELEGELEEDHRRARRAESEKGRLGRNVGRERERVECGNRRDD